MDIGWIGVIGIFVVCLVEFSSRWWIVDMLCWGGYVLSLVHVLYGDFVLL